MVERSYEDPSRAQDVRKQLYQSLNQIGVVNRSGVIDNNAWSNFVSAQFLRKQNPIKPDGYPEFEDFKVKFDEYQSEHTIFEIQRHSMDPARYLYGLGQVIHDKVVYENIFKNDDIKIGDAGVVNGKHREATIEVLRMCGFNKPTPWVKFEYE